VVACEETLVALVEESSDCVIALDLGGTWIKGAAQSAANPAAEGAEARRWRNPVGELADAGQFALFLEKVCRELAEGRAIGSVCIATAGEVDALGNGYLATAPHLGLMGTNQWQAPLKAALRCPLTLINDAEAFVLGVAERGKLPRRGNVGVMPIGTGLGFAVVRDGRIWKPARRLNLFGSVLTADGTLDDLVSASAVAKEAGGDLTAFLRDTQWCQPREAYFDRLARAAAGAGVLYFLDDIIIGGGLADAAAAANVDLAQAIAGRIPALLPRGIAVPRISVLAEANQTQLQGTLALAQGNRVVEPARFVASYDGLHTELPQSNVAMEEMPAGQIVQTLWQAEQSAGEKLIASLPAIAAVAERIASVVPQGGRVIYVGAGTSGRVAALDAVEMPCTYSTPPDQFLAVIAGGVSDVALTIEENNEEDASSVGDLLLLQPTARDVVIGISASGSAFFVRSALAFARSRGAYAVLIHEGTAEKQFFDVDISLGSGSELISGSTRMKAGTATKKVLNFLSTTAMVRLGKVQHGYMTDFEPTNEKLRKRAHRILKHISRLDDEAINNLILRHTFHLRPAIVDYLKSRQ
jgi:N-acetylmuramic acid 6-phosphate etherase